MKPYKMFLVFVLTFALIAVVACIFPKTGIQIGESLILKFHWSFSNINDTTKITYADISGIIDENRIIIEQALQNDTLTAEPVADTLRANAVALNKRIQQIEYPAGDSTILFPFFEKLQHASQKRVRVLHYGDSQIEGDRITGYLRNKMQKKFGGSGPGLLPAVPGHAESSSIIHHASSNWLTHSVYYKKDTVITHREFGVLGSFSRFTEYADDSTLSESKKKMATIEFRRSGLAYSSVNDFTQCRVFYGHNNSELTVKGFVNDSLIWFEDISQQQRTRDFHWNFKTAPRSFRIQFESDKSPDIYAVALDAKNGVAVDNLPFRGSSGTEFTKLNIAQLTQMAKSLNSGLILYEFGVNVVPHIVNNYDYYERLITKQLNYLKQAFPGTPILVIGTSDIARRNGEFYESYPNIEKIKEAQREAAKNTNSAFWDLYQAMGGKNSMPSWVFAEPPLAGKDFTHFNRAGGHVVAQMLFNALMLDFEKCRESKSEAPAEQKISMSDN